MPRGHAAPRLETARLLLQASTPAMAPEVLDFQARNQDHFAPWDPPMPAGYLSLDAQRERLRRSAHEFRSGNGYRYWLRLRDDPAGVVGTMNFSSVARGPFQSAMLGYQIDRALEGHGLMHEALQAGIAEMFSARVHLHRVQAAHLPENTRSAAVLARLGFERIGVSRWYLFIDGAWRDHVLNALVNPSFVDAPV
ncbi:MAG TPA: GNAT family N-acetyltransferase [Albitalea sp.]|uniref:GNAT family N-acetyltransferase n=1 Tax=Piscinibacter sp. TaxID=1903157 RepID=UPI002ED25C63